MELSLYRLSLFLSIPLMLFFGFHMLFARLPRKKNVSNFLFSRRLMGSALLILASNYLVHLLVSPRFIDVNATILLNMLTYFLCYWLFTAALMTLLEKDYVTGRRFRVNLLLWAAYSLAAVLTCFLPDELEVWVTAFLACLLVAYGVRLSYRILKTYRKATKLFADTRSDDIGAYIRWLSVFTYWAVAYGVGCGLLTFLPDQYVFIWILTSIPFYIYLYCCYQNYIFYYEDVEQAILEDGAMEEAGETIPDGIQTRHQGDIALRIEEWVARDGYLTPGITLNELSQQIGTNRTYLSEYVNNVCGKTFRDWISDLRIEYAKRLLVQNPQMKIQEISEKSGFLSLSHFTRIFKETEGCTPAQWRRDRN
ncbi:MAG: helix-turn-helix domain-containing protein [Candidatus Cryptobacteroides sp.]